MAVINDKLIGSRIRAARLQYGFTQEQAASKLQVTEAYWSRIENGRARINLERLYDICQLFHLNEMSLLEGCCSELSNGDKEAYTDPHVLKLLDLLNHSSPSTLKMMAKVCQTIYEESENA